MPDMNNSPRLSAGRISPGGCSEIVRGPAVELAKALCSTNAEPTVQSPRSSRTLSSDDVQAPDPSVRAGSVLWVWLLRRSRSGRG
jgi:hypothetical protein